MALPGYLLADEAEAAVLPDALEGLSQQRVEGFVVVPERRGGVTGDSKGSDVNLQERKDNHLSVRPFPIRPTKPSAGVDWTHHPLVGVRRVVGGVQQVAVLQLLTEPLQQVHGLVESSRHGHPGQVFTWGGPADDYL